MDYEEVLVSPRFRGLVNSIKNKTGNQCQLCGQREDLHAHHLSYDNLGNESESEILIVCRKCHVHCHNLHDGHGFAVKSRGRKWIYDPDFSKIKHLDGEIRRLDKLPPRAKIVNLDKKKLYVPKGSKKNLDYSKRKGSGAISNYAAWGKYSARVRQALSIKLKITMDKLYDSFIHYDYKILKKVEKILEIKIYPLSEKQKALLPLPPP